MNKIRFSSSFKKFSFRNSLAVQWLRLHAVTAEGLGSITVQGTKIPQAMQCSQKKIKNKKRTKQKISLALWVMEVLC